MNETVIIIGAGAAGLMAAYELSKHKIKVVVLEANEKPGGRINTLTDTAFEQPVELGAEFIHGDVPVTLHLLQQANISYTKLSGKMLRIKKGKMQQQHDEKGWNKLMRCMQELKEDVTLEQFLKKYFNDEKYDELRKSVQQFAEGFDLADVSKASVKSLYREWSHEMENQYRVNRGYMQLINWLVNECKKNGCIFHYNCCVKKINWTQNKVEINTLCSRYFTSNKIIITASLGVLQANEKQEAFIEFSPSIPQHIKAANEIGYGSVIKILLQFKEAFWSNEKKNISFIITSETISTYWTQSPEKNNILTGWLGGTNAVAMKDKTDEEVLMLTLQSLSQAFNTTTEDLQSHLTAYNIANWTNNKYSLGAYSYNFIESDNAKKILRQPINNTLFFAGEALYEDVPGGTVEAALSSGQQTAHKIIKAL